MERLSQLMIKEKYIQIFIVFVQAELNLSTCRKADKNRATSSAAHSILYPGGFEPLTYGSGAGSMENGCAENFTLHHRQQGACPRGHRRANNKRIRQLPRRLSAQPRKAKVVRLPSHRRKAPVLCFVPD
jgi:hypothetical protein